MMLEAGEGYIPVDGGGVWYRIVGSGNTIPLLCLHGGPGFCHDYLETMADLAPERPVIFYDQLGCGNSERPSDPSLWIPERFVVELAQVRSALGLDRVHILGQSWGSMLLVDYVLTKPKGVLSIVLASPCTSIPMWLSDTNRLRKALPREISDVLDKHEAAGTMDSPQYQAATIEYYKRHLCRMEPWPISMQRSMAKAAYAIYHTMWGATEFNMTNGNLRYYDRTSRLHEIQIPTLWTCGRFDEAQPETVAFYQSLLPDSELIVFENSSHTAHLEERERYMQVIRGFLFKVERNLSR
jgi:proline iminopeptidase